jgi:hypothetical protein
MTRARRTSLVLSSLAFLLVAGCASGNQNQQQDEVNAESSNKAQGSNNAQGGSKAAKMKKIMKQQADKSEMPSDKDVEATVSQEEGKVTYWVLPGPRELDSYFGTRENPKLTAEPPANAPKPVKQLLEDLPILVGVPEKARTYKNGTAMTEMPTPFGDKGVPVQNSALELTYMDRQSEDGDGPPTLIIELIVPDTTRGQP